METTGLTCKIPLELHNQIREEIYASGSTVSKFIEMATTSKHPRPRTATRKSP